MTGEEILRAASQYCDDDIDRTDALTAINEAIAWLGDTGMVYNTSAITAVAGEWVDLPEDMIHLVEVLDGAGEPYFNYSLSGPCKIRFSDDGTYTIRYRQQPVPLDNLTNTPSIHVSYHSTLTTYLKGWYKVKDDDESADGQRLLQQFQVDATRVFNTLRRKRTPNTVRVIRAAVIG